MRTVIDQGGIDLVKIEDPHRPQFWPHASLSIFPGGGPVVNYTNPVFNPDRSEPLIVDQEPIPQTIPRVNLGDITPMVHLDQPMSANHTMDDICK